MEKINQESEKDKKKELQKKLNKLGFDTKRMKISDMEELLLQETGVPQMDTEKKNDSKKSTEVVSEENQTLIKEIEQNITFEEEQKKRELAFFDQWNDKVEEKKLEEKTVPKQKDTLKNKTLVYPRDYQSNTSQRNMAYVPPERLVQEIRDINNKKSQEKGGLKQKQMEGIIQKIITHDGPFHEDDVFALSILKDLFPESITRASGDKKKFVEYERTRNKKTIAGAVNSTSTMLVDVGDKNNPKKFNLDHHQKGGAGERANKIKYASAGLVWKQFGREWLDYIDAYAQKGSVGETKKLDTIGKMAGQEEQRTKKLTEEEKKLIWKLIDKQYVQMIDASDTDQMSDVSYSLQNADNIRGAHVTTSENVRLANIDTNDGRTQKQRFEDTVEQYRKRNIGMVQKYINLVEDLRKFNIESCEFSTDKKTVIIKQLLNPASVGYIIDNEPALKEVEFYATLNSSKQYTISVAPVAEGLREYRNPNMIPKPLRQGSNTKEIEKVLGIKDGINFCHEAGFVASCKNIDATRKFLSFCVNYKEPEAQQTVASVDSKNKTEPVPTATQEPKKDIDQQIPDTEESKDKKDDSTKKEKVTLANDEETAFEEKLIKTGFKIGDFEGTEFEQLSFGKRMLLLETMEQQLLDKVKRDAVSAFEEEVREKKWFGRTWKNIRRRYHIAEQEKALIAKHKIESLISKDTTSALVDTIESITAKIELRDGKAEIEYLKEERGYHEQQRAEQFNIAANIFARVPAEWKFSNNKKEQKMYQKAEASFNDIKSQIVAQEKTNDKRVEVLERLQRATGEVNMLQYLMANPEAGQVLAKTESSWSQILALKSNLKEKGGVKGTITSATGIGFSLRAAAGYIGRSEMVIESVALTTRELSLIATPVIGVIIGGWRATAKAKQELKKTDIETRRSATEQETIRTLEKKQQQGITLTKEEKAFLNETKLKKKVFGAEEINNVFDYFTAKIAATTDPEKKKRLVASLEARTGFIKHELEKGNITFGAISETEGNTDADRIRRYMQFTQKLADATILTASLREVKPGEENTEDGKNAEVIATMKRRIEAVEKKYNEKNKKVNTKRNIHLVKQMTAGAMIGAGAGLAGWWVRDNYGLISNGVKNTWSAVEEGVAGGVEKAKHFINETQEAVELKLRGIHIPFTDSEEVDDTLIKNLRDADGHTVVPEKGTVVFEKATSVRVSSKGFIKTIEDLKATFLKEHPGEELPVSLKENPTEIAKRLGLYKPDATAESGMVIANKDTTLGINEQGDIVLHDATKNTDTILSAKNTFKGSFIETGKVNIPAQEGLQTDYTESSHSENTETYIENEKNIPAETSSIDHSAISFFKKELSDKNTLSLLSEKYVDELQESNPELWKQIQALGDETTIHSDPDEKALPYIQRALEAKERAVSPDPEHFEIKPVEKLVHEEDAQSEDVEGDVSPEEDTIKTPTQTPEQVLDEPLDTPKTRGVMPPEQVSQMIEARTQGNVDGTLDGIFGQRRNFLFDRNVIEGSGARNPAWTKIANMNAFEFFKKTPQGYENLRGAIDELRSTSNFPEPLKDNPMTLEQYLKIASREHAKIEVAKEIKAGTFKQK